MQHTYLRYECADSFGLVTSSASSQAPQSNSILAFCGGTGPSSSPLLLTTAGSCCLGYHLKTTDCKLKLAHREQLSGGVGTGRALNSDQVVCLDVFNLTSGGGCKVATGWVDGAVRIFDVHERELTAPKGCGLVQSLLQESSTNEDFVMREPLILNGHSGSPVRSVSFDVASGGARLATGSSDGSVVLWDIVAETGLFRLLGHRGGITDIHFVSMQQPQGGMLDLLVTTSLDGFVKVWDLKGQCCIQTIPSHKGEVWAAACLTIPESRQIPGSSDSTTMNERIRLITGSSDGQARIWSMSPPKRYSTTPDGEGTSTPTIVEDDTTEKKDEGNVDDICHYMGTLTVPANMSTSGERISCIHFHPNGKYVGVLHANTKNVDVYCVRSIKESLRKRQRRLRRRKEKARIADKKNDNKKGPKRGLLDDPVSEGEENVGENEEIMKLEKSLDPEHLKASDEFEYFGTVHASHKVKGFIFVPLKESGGGIRIVCSLATNALEVHSLKRTKASDGKSTTVVSNKVSTTSFTGHPTGIRGIELSSDDAFACTVSKNTTKIWNVAKRSCVQSLSPAVDGNSCYGLCSAFLPGNTHVVLGTREGHLLVLDIAAGEVVFVEQRAHEGAIWSIDVRNPTPHQSSVVIVTGSADKMVKFWEVEAQDDISTPMLVHSRTLEMSDDVVAVRYSNSSDPTKRMVFVSCLDSTIKVFFDDTLKFFLSLYGHKLPALAVDASDDDTILASSGADKTVKIWGLDFGDTHRTLHGHEDSITDLRFVRRTHNFFTSSKDGTVRYWDGDRFEQILVLNGHFAEVSSLTISRTGAFVLSAGMDRQIRVWERTKDIVFLEEERERELERMFDGVGRDAEETGKLLKRKGEEYEEGDEGENEPQSEAAVKRSVLSVASGDRIMEALERADQETKEIAAWRKKNPGKDRSPNLLMLGLEPSQYVLWVLKSVKLAELEQSLLVLPLGHVERLLYYLILLLRSGRSVELCARISVFLVKTHQNQILTSRTIAVPLRELRRLLKDQLEESRDKIGFNLAALRAIARTNASRKESYYLDYDADNGTKDVWAGMGLGSDLAAALQSRRKLK
ncbi:WD40 repeat-containing protein [Nitzschia inconspicua]|uniref:WD40 repeat-containing protein n=1 Tax=Nitzschia inconspicua TaxID=303405 RepID=A0A9K3L2V3_9STRA|nr:WD40 repeat-containing protein [Nitzschia inconspicua]